MSKNWTFVTGKQVWLDKSLSIEAKAIWHIMASWRDHKTGECHPRTWTMQQVSGLGRNKVQEAIKELVNAGAVVKRTIRHRTPSGMAGSKCIYTVMAPSAWKAKDLHVAAKNEVAPEEKRENPICGRPRSGTTTEGSVSVSHLQTLNHPQTLTLSPRPSTGNQEGLRLTENEVEDLMAVRGIGGSGIEVFRKLEAGSWLDKHKVPFTTRQNLEAYAAGLAEKMDACRTELRTKPKAVAGW